MVTAFLVVPPPPLLPPPPQPDIMFLPCPYMSTLPGDTPASSPPTRPHPPNMMTTRRQPRPGTPVGLAALGTGAGDWSTYGPDGVLVGVVPRGREVGLLGGGGYPFLSVRSRHQMWYRTYFVLPNTIFLTQYAPPLCL